MRGLRTTYRGRRDDSLLEWREEKASGGDWRAEENWKENEGLSREY